MHLIRPHAIKVKSYQFNPHKSYNKSYKFNSNKVINFIPQKVTGIIKYFLKVISIKLNRKILKVRFF